MFKREEASRLREEFWTVFGKYMGPVPSAEGMKVNWINYRTSLKDVRFRMDVNQKSAMISITLEQPEPDIRDLYFDQFLELKNQLHAALKEEWEWQHHTQLTSDKVVSRIYKEMIGVSVLNKDHWPELISFFKPRILALDRFWETARFSFEALK